MTISEVSEQFDIYPDLKKEKELMNVGEASTSLNMYLPAITLFGESELSSFHTRKVWSVPKTSTAYKGFAALLHSIEGYISKHANTVSDMFFIAAIENIGRNLAKAVSNGGDSVAHKKVEFGKTISNAVISEGHSTGLHYLQYAMSAYHPELPHDAGLIVLSKAYFSHMINKHVCDDRFVRMAKAMEMEAASEPMDFITKLVRLKKDCGVNELRMSDYGIKRSEFETMAKNVTEIMGGLFIADRCGFSIEDCIKIYEKSYK